MTCNRPEDMPRYDELAVRAQPSRRRRWSVCAAPPCAGLPFPSTRACSSLLRSAASCPTQARAHTHTHTHTLPLLPQACLEVAPACVALMLRALCVYQGAMRETEATRRQAVAALSQLAAQPAADGAQSNSQDEADRMLQVHAVHAAMRAACCACCGVRCACAGAQAKVDLMLRPRPPARAALLLPCCCCCRALPGCGV